MWFILSSQKLIFFIMMQISIFPWNHYINLIPNWNTYQKCNAKNSVESFWLNTICIQNWNHKKTCKNGVFWLFFIVPTFGQNGVQINLSGNYFTASFFTAHQLFVCILTVVRYCTVSTVWKKWEKSHQFFREINNYLLLILPHCYLPGQHWISTKCQGKNSGRRCISIYRAKMALRDIDCYIPGLNLEPGYAPWDELAPGISKGR